MRCLNMINKEKNFISVVVYLHNNEDNINNFVQKITPLMSNTFENFEFVFVNDYSTDNTIDVLKESLNISSSPISNIINMSFYQGQEMSMNAGVDLAIGDFVFEFDTVNINYDIQIILDSYIKCLAGFDIVSTSNAKQKLSSRLFYKVFNKYSNNVYAIRSETFRIISRRAINRIQSMHKSIPYRKAIYSNCGLSYFTIEYKSISNSKAKWLVNEKLFRRELAIDSLIIFTDFAYKFSLVMSLLFIAFTISVATYAVVILLVGSPVAGWTTTMLFTSFAFFGNFLFFAVIIKYLTILLNLVFKNKNYTIESINKFNR